MSKPREARLSGNDFNPERFVHQDEASTAVARPTCETTANRAYELYLTRGAASTPSPVGFPPIGGWSAPNGRPRHLRPPAARFASRGSDHWTGW